MQKDIKNLEEIIELCKEELNNNDKNVTATLDLIDLKELRNLINRTKELEEMLKHRIKYTNELEQDLFENASNYVIPKSKVKEKIEELKEKYHNEYLTNYYGVKQPNTMKEFEYKIQVLEELLEE